MYHGYLAYHLSFAAKFFTVFHKNELRLILVAYDLVQRGRYECRVRMSRRELARILGQSARWI